MDRRGRNRAGGPGRYRSGSPISRGLTSTPAPPNRPPIQDHASRIAETSAIIREITDRKRLEKLLRESEARLQAIMDNSPAMIFFKDTQGRYLNFNRRFGDVFKLSLEQTVGKTDAEIFPPSQAAAFRTNDLKVLEAGVPIVFDEVSVHADGPWSMPIPEQAANAKESGPHPLTNLPLPIYL